ncbi:MAG TPA: ubiquinol-cytochrome c reductase iron-sulfur subunit [Burkholderiales bacterium]
MSDPNKPDRARRSLLVATAAIGGAASAGAAVPFVASWFPSERARAAGAPIEVDISNLAPGELGIFEWRGKPVWVFRRTKEMLATLRKVDAKVSDPKSDVPQQPEYAKNENRSLKPDVMVVVGICTHLGCSPKEKGADAKAELGADWEGGFYCPCHGSKFDLAGRVYKGAPAPTNLEVPPHMYLSEGRILVGEDKKGA